MDDESELNEDKYDDYASSFCIVLYRIIKRFNSY